jgi:F0F1-type ATP synthase epsilon subunit
MENQYKATSEYGKAIFGEDTFDADFTAAEEKDHVDGGHLEIVPRDYEVLSDNFSEGSKGDVYTAALPKEREEWLLGGYHLKRLDPLPEKKPAAKKATSKKAEPEGKDPEE